MPLLATGGVDAANAGEFLRAGAVAVGVGYSLATAADAGAPACALVSAVRP